MNYRSCYRKLCDMSDRVWYYNDLVIVIEFTDPDQFTVKYRTWKVMEIANNKWYSKISTTSPALIVLDQISLKCLLFTLSYQYLNKYLLKLRFEESIKQQASFCALMGFRRSRVYVSHEITKYRLRCCYLDRTIKYILGKTCMW